MLNKLPKYSSGFIGKPILKGPELQNSDWMALSFFKKSNHQFLTASNLGGQQPPKPRFHARVVEVGQSYNTCALADHSTRRWVICLSHSFSVVVQFAKGKVFVGPETFVEVAQPVIPNTAIPRWRTTLWRKKSGGSCFNRIHFNAGIQGLPLLSSRLADNP